MSIACVLLKRKLKLLEAGSFDSLMLINADRALSDRA
jgi:hypothetical protein